jgi:hypothetical protein
LGAGAGSSMLGKIEEKRFDNRSMRTTSDRRGAVEFR